MKIKKGDNVVVLSGKDKGKTGTVLEAMPKTEQVVIEGVNVAVKHQKNRRVRSQGQIIERSMPIHASNVAVAEGGKPTRVGYKVENGKKIRVSKKTGKTL